MHRVWPFILCGGVGTRLWPLSREAYPKQFHRLTGHETLFQETCRRVTGPRFGELWILANHRHRFLIAEQLEEIGLEARNIVLEPVNRNTAPSAAIAALIAARQDPDALILLAPSDHMVANPDELVRAIETGLAFAQAGALVTFGVEPDCPHTGYGYIEVAPGRASAGNVLRFVEKPSPEAAERYLEQGNFYWNSGLFLFKAGTMLDLLGTHAPEILAACREAVDGAKEDLTFHLLGEAFAEAPAISLDYAVAEKTSGMICAKLDTPWSDLGSWDALWNFMIKDEAGNVAKGDGEVVLQETRDSFAFSDRACVALVGVENLIVVALEDAVLVVAKDRAEQIRKLVDDLKGNGSTIALQHNRVYRPWGWYQSLDRGERHRVKCIMVKPGGKLSLQSHRHRSEHWVVVTGTLEVTRGEKTELLSENQSTYIPIGEKHRLANPGKIPAFLIEVQSGSYLGEDDIVRYDDIYRRGATE
jgi:mannose-1-phosphate guanylyltransferase / mannose-6-phosphate isomerase